MIADYLNAVSYSYSLSVFSEESGAASGPKLTEEELCEILRIENNTLLHHAVRKFISEGQHNTGTQLNLHGHAHEHAVCWCDTANTEYVGLMYPGDWFMPTKAW